MPRPMAVTDRDPSHPSPSAAPADEITSTTCPWLPTRVTKFSGGPGLGGCGRRVAWPTNMPVIMMGPQLYDLTRKLASHGHGSAAGARTVRLARAGDSDRQPPPTSESGGRGRPAGEGQWHAGLGRGPGPAGLLRCYSGPPLHMPPAPGTLVAGPARTLVTDKNTPPKMVCPVAEFVPTILNVALTGGAAAFALLYSFKYHIFSRIFESKIEH